MICIECKEENKPGASFCLRCGTWFTPPESHKSNVATQPARELHPNQISPEGERKCPLCAELIKIEAVKCKHCGSMLNNKSVSLETISTPTKVCRFCAEDIDKDATICPHCQRQQAQRQPQNERDGVNMGGRPANNQSQGNFSGGSSSMQKENTSSYEKGDERDLELMKIEFERRKKSLLAAYLFLVFLGGTGAHRFYVGDKTAGWIFVGLLLTCWLAVPIVISYCWQFIDLFRLPGIVGNYNRSLQRELMLRYRV